MPKNKWDTINNVFPTDLFGKKLENFSILKREENSKFLNKKALRKILGAFSIICT